MEKKVIRKRSVYTLPESVAGRSKTTKPQSSRINNKPPHNSPPIRGSVGVISFLGVKNITTEILKTELSGLSETTRQELLDFLALLKNQKKDTPDFQRKIAMWTDSLNIALGKALGNKLTTFPPVMNAPAKKLLKEVQDFMIECKLENLSTPESKVMFNMLAKMLVAHAAGVSSKVKIPLTMKLVLQTTTPLIALFDNIYPGYVKSGLVGKILFASSNSIIIHDDDEED